MFACCRYANAWGYAESPARGSLHLQAKARDVIFTNKITRANHIIEYQWVPRAGKNNQTCAPMTYFDAGELHSLYVAQRYMYLYICTYVYTLILTNQIYRVFLCCMNEGHAIQCHLLNEYIPYTDLRIAIHEGEILRLRAYTYCLVSTGPGKIYRI